MQSPLKILYVDDHIALCDSLAQTLKSKKQELTIFTANNIESAIQVFAQNDDISVVLLDLNLNGKSGLELIPHIRRVNRQVKIIIFTMFSDPIHIEQALHFEVDGYITKTISVDEVLEAIITVSNGNTCYNREARSVMKTLMGTVQTNTQEPGSIQEIFALYKSLTKKEQQIFELLAQKKDFYEIAKILGRAEKTIQNQKSIIYQKMNIHDMLGVIEAAQKLGIIF